jgi:hypothetical protein
MGGLEGGLSTAPRNQVTTTRRTSAPPSAPQRIFRVSPRARAFAGPRRAAPLLNAAYGVPVPGVRSAGTGGTECRSGYTECQYRVHGMTVPGIRSAGTGYTECRHRGYGVLIPGVRSAGTGYTECRSGCTEHQDHAGVQVLACRLLGAASQNIMPTVSLSVSVSGSLVGWVPVGDGSRSCVQMGTLLRGAVLRGAAGWGGSAREL